MTSVCVSKIPFQWTPLNLPYILRVCEEIHQETSQTLRGPRCKHGIYGETLTAWENAVDSTKKVIPDNVLQSI